MKQQRWMSQQYFIFFMAWGIFLPYWTGFLVHEKNVSIEIASMMMSAGLVLRGISTMFIFPAMTGKWSQKTVLTIFILGAFFTSILFLLDTNEATLFLLTCLLSFFLPAIMPGLDSTAGLLVQEYKIHYGKSRSYGSIGFVVSVAIVSVVSAKFGDQSMLWLLISYLIILILLSFMQAPEILKMKPNGKASFSSFKSVIKTKNFLVILFIVTLIQGSHAAYYNYGYLYLEHLEVPKYLIGIVINIGVVFEILLFSVADKWFSKWTPAKLLVLAASGAALRWFTAFALSNAWIFAFSQTLHALSFATAHFAFMMYLTQKMKNTQITKAQGIYSAFALSWGTAILTILSGHFYEIEPSSAYFTMFICTIPAIVAALYLHVKTTK